MTGEVALDGCRPEPLGAYFKALGVFRLVAQQLDPSVTAHWAGDRLVLGTDRTLDEIVAFLVDAYRPTPIVSPWNSRSGFRLDRNNPTEQRMRQFRATTAERWRPYREAVAVADEVFSRLLPEGWDDKQVKGEKSIWVQECRSVLPDEALPWIDAVAVLTGDSVQYPPLLGTGGVLGSGDLANNFIGTLLTVSSPEGDPSPESRPWALQAIARQGTPEQPELLIGQFDPGAAGATSPTGASERTVTNPWDFILMLEGVPLFASGAARRMAAEGDGKAAMPFMFDATPVGYPSAVEGESTKGELWAPLWDRPVSLGEIGRLLGEGRMEWRGVHARRAIDAVRAAASLGVDRGINAFVRYVFVERMGQAMLAVPVGRIDTAKVLRREIPLVGELDRWVDQVRRSKNLPASQASVLRRLDQAMYDLAADQRPDRASAVRHLQKVLTIAAELERLVARSRTARDEVAEPLGNPARRRNAIDRQWPLDAARWLPRLDDGSPELRLAASLASGRDRPSPPTGPGDDRTRLTTPAALLRGVQPVGRRSGPDTPTEDGRPPDEMPPTAPSPSSPPTDAAVAGDRTTAREARGSGGRWWGWRPDGQPVVPGLGTGRLLHLVGELVQRRAIEAGPRGRDETGPADSPATEAAATEAPTGDDTSADSHHGQESRAEPAWPLVHSPTGIDPSFTDGIETPLEEVVRFASGDVDDVRLEELLGALLLLRYRQRQTLSGPFQNAENVAVPPALALVLPFFHGRRFRPADAATRRLAPYQVRLWAGHTWPRLLAAGRVDEVVNDALRRLRATQLVPLVEHGEALAKGMDGPRLLAATAFRLSTPDVRALLAQVATTDHDLPVAAPPSAPSSQGET